jgi:O-methyltransferase involved in polyketide biosynthesis
VVCQQALRAKMLDDRVREFTSAHPDAVVIDLGAGLSTAMMRIGPPSGVDWYDVDLPNVIALRDRVVPDRERAHSIAASVADDRWTDAIPADRATMLIADGLFAFLSEPVIANLFRHITVHFRSGELAFNDYGRMGRLTTAAMKLAPRKATSTVGRQWGYPGFKDAHHPETWNPRLTLVEEASLSHAPEVDLFPTRLRISTRLAGRFQASARKARILRYRF